MNVALHPATGFHSINAISICTGGGGLDLGLELAIPGYRPVAYVEREAFACAHLVAAMEQGLLAPAPLWSDARTFPGRAFRGRVDCVVGGIPCQPHSVAGKRLGREDERDLWSSFRRILVQTGAWCALIENVPGMVTSGGLERVWRDLHRLGFAVEAGLFSAEEVGASHGRERLFVLAIHQSALTGGGGWPTATANDFKGSGPTLMRRDGKMRGDRLDYAAEQIWTTPSAGDGQRGGAITQAMTGTSLTQQVNSIWSTPTAHDGRRPGLDIHATQGASLSKDVGVWPTIRAAEAGGYQYSRGDRTKPVPTLTGAGTAWSTPSVADVTGGRMSRSGDRSDEALMKRQAEMVTAALANGLSSRPVRATGYGAPSRLSILSAFQRYRATTCSSMRAELRALIRMAIRAERAGQRRGFTRPAWRKSLNARFVAWLMGWPDHWTRTASTPSACSATALCLWQARMRSELSALPLPGDMVPIQPDLFGGPHD